MATLVEKVKIEIGGKLYEGKAEEEYNFLNISLSQQLLQPNSLSFTMQKKGLGDSMKDSAFPKPIELMGEKVSCTIEAQRFNEKDELEKNTELLEFKGIIFDVNVYRRGDMFSEQLMDIMAYSPDYLLNDHPHCFSYENDNLKKIVTATLDPHDIPNKINPRTTEPIPYTVQYNETNYQFLTRLAQRYGEWMYNDGTKWIFGEIEKKEAVKLDARNDIQNYHFQAGLIHHTLTHAHHNYLTYENPSKSDKDLSDLESSGYHILTDAAKEKSKKWFTKETFQHLQCSNPEDNDLDEPDISTKAQLYGEKTQQVVCTGTSVRADLTIGSCIKIEDHFYDDDKNHQFVEYDELMITGIVHSTEVNGQYSNHFTAVPANSKYPPYSQSDIFPVSAAQRAKVKDNNDEEKLGRIRVQFLWQEEQHPDMMTPWIRIAQPYGGDDKGFYFLPELGEEVMVEFENGNAEKPFVVGTLFHGKQLPGKKWPTEDNDIKAIRTRNGHTIEIHDEGDDGFIRIYDHEKENYILTFSTDNKLIRLESTGNIELYAKQDIILKAKNDIIMKAENNFEATGKEKAILHSDTKAIVQSEKDTEIIGDPTLVHSNSDLTLEAMTAAKMEANSTINVEAQATTTIKGAMVQIN